MTAALVLPEGFTQLPQDRCFQCGQSPVDPLWGNWHSLAYRARPGGCGMPVQPADPAQLVRYALYDAVSHCWPWGTRPAEAMWDRVRQEIDEIVEIFPIRPVS